MAGDFRMHRGDHGRERRARRLSHFAKAGWKPAPWGGAGLMPAVKHQPCSVGRAAHHRTTPHPTKKPRQPLWPRGRDCALKNAEAPLRPAAGKRKQWERKQGKPRHHHADSAGHGMGAKALKSSTILTLAPGARAVKVGPRGAGFQPCPASPGRQDARTTAKVRDTPAK
jgi:hypothetical protein